MSNSREQLYDLLFKVGDQHRWVQDSPISPSVWAACVEKPGKKIDLLLTPRRPSRPADLAGAVIERLSEHDGGSELNNKQYNPRTENQIAYNDSTVVLRATFEELVRCLAPMSKWYEQKIGPHVEGLSKYGEAKRRTKKLTALAEAVHSQRPGETGVNEIVLWWLGLTGFVLGQEENADESDPLAAFCRAAGLLVEPLKNEYRIYRIALNRPASISCLDSVRTIKADAAKRVFGVDTSPIRWAVLDTGIDAQHQAFLNEEGDRSRVEATYDFTRMRELFVLASTPGEAAAEEIEEKFHIDSDQAREVKESVMRGGDVTWEAIEPALRVDSGKDPEELLSGYASQINSHGTHVAGLLGGRTHEVQEFDETFSGVCPDIRLIDLRVLDAQGRSTAVSGQAEFDILAALQFISYLNASTRQPFVHGINLSIQLLHDANDYACGRTPVCEECNRLVDEGVVVVAAAGNKGIDRGAATATTTEGAYQGISIADPGNAEEVITVGSTHRKRPHTYGVSYFSSRGPTGDGRSKPDLVAPGEKILGPIVGGGYDSMQGTSQAAPYVSGAAAMLLARHRELIGNPRSVKKILCDTATDLERERHFQGAGLVDILRALQSI